VTSTNAQINVDVTNFVALFVDRVQATPDKEAFRYLDQGEWVSITWRDAATRVGPLAAGLLASAGDGYADRQGLTDGVG
jgi:acyl-CoA synthetase (AMP-forming)/AMP-acid ligase II